MFPADWQISQGADVTTALAPDGTRFRYYERLRPMPSFAQIVALALGNDPEFAVREVGVTEPLRTAEGELGAWVAIEGRDARRIIAAVFVDEFAAALDVVGTADFEPGARELVLGLRFGLARRPRRFWYEPPPGWQALPSGLTATWYPSDYPRVDAKIVVPPAVIGEDRYAGESITNAAGDEGVLAGNTAIFVVPPYTYRFELHGDAHDAFRALINSFRTVGSV